MGTHTRELRPALTPAELAESDDVFRHAQANGIKLRGNQHVRAVSRCNQLAPDFSVCDWSARIETTAIDAVQDGKLALAAHLRRDHPYLGLAGIGKVLGATWVNMRDIGG